MPGIQRCSAASAPLSKPLSKLAKAANREHQRATQSATNAIDHARAAGEALAKARDICDAGQWSLFVDQHFSGSLRTAQKYIRLARHFRMISAQGPATALSSQNQATKALRAIVEGDSSAPGTPKTTGTRRARGASRSHALAAANVAVEALRDVERDLNESANMSYHVRAAQRSVRAALDRVTEAIFRASNSAGAAPPRAEPEAQNVEEAMRGGLDEVVG